MKSASADVQNFMASANEAWKPNLYTLTLSGGTVYRWTSADVPVQVPGGYLFSLGLPIDDTGYDNERGLKAGTIDVNFYIQGGGGAPYQINGIPWTLFIELGGLTGALLTIERALAPSSSAPIVGTYIRFKGRFSQVKQLTDMLATCTFADWREVLDAYIPPHVYQAGCRHVLGDSRCGIDLSSYAVTGAVAAGTATLTTFPTNLTRADGYFGLGKVKFTSGVNNGLWRTVKSYAHASGVVQLVLGLPSAPSAGDAFTIYPGCDLSSNTCTSKFNNLIHDGGEEFVPVPETLYQ